MALTWPDVSPSAGGVVLRPFHDSDLPLVAELAEDPYVPQIGSVPSPYSPSEGLAYLRRQHQRLADGRGWSFAVADRTDDRALGGAGLWLQDDPEQASLGYVVAPSARGRGVATAALTALTAFAWTRPRLRRLVLWIEPWNAASIRVAGRCGYAPVAQEPQHALIGGSSREVLVHARERSG